MKPWLLNILACPICKHHPVSAYFFDWETDEKDLQSICQKAGKVEAKFESEYGLLAKQLLDGTISPPAIEVIDDRTGDKATKGLLRRVRKILGRIGVVKGKTRERIVEEFKIELDVIHRYLNLIEVDKGLLVCEKCGRWYPIGRAVEGVPEMLPDDLREKEELQFLKQWEDKIPKRVLKKGKPFNLGS